MCSLICILTNNVFVGGNSPQGTSIHKEITKHDISAYYSDLTTKFTMTCIIEGE